MHVSTTETAYSDPTVVRATPAGAREIVHSVKDTTVLALEGAKDIGTAAVGTILQVAAHTTSQALKAAETVGTEFASVSTNLFIKVIRGIQQVTSAAGDAVLETARGYVRGVGTMHSEIRETGRAGALETVSTLNQVGAATKGSALGLIQGAAEVSSELGSLWKNSAQEAVKGVGAVTSDVVFVTKSLSLGAVQGTGEVALQVEDAVMNTARAFVRDLREVQSPPAASPLNQEPTEIDA